MLGFSSSRPIAIRGLISIASKKNDPELYRNMLVSAKKSKVPFDNFVNNPRGTPGYFPRFSKGKIEPWLPRVEANDFIADQNNKYPFMLDRSLVYKIDSYCLGRVLYFLKFVYDENKRYYCYNGEKQLGHRLNGMIDALRHDNVYKRISINECLELYFLY